MRHLKLPNMLYSMICKRTLQCNQILNNQNSDTRLCHIVMHENGTQSRTTIKGKHIYRKYGPGLNTDSAHNSLKCSC